MRAGGCTCNLVCRVGAGQGFICGTTGAPGGGWQRYSRKVPQQVRIQEDGQGCGRTVTCGYGRGWTCCREMACKRSAVRARLAPPGQMRNSNRANRQYSRKVQQRRPGGPPYVCSDRAPSPARAAGRTPGSRRWIGGGQPVTWANPSLVGPVTLAAWSPSGPPGGPFLPVTVAGFASGLAALAVRSTPRNRARWPRPRAR